MRKFFLLSLLLCVLSCQKRLDEPLYGEIEILFSEASEALGSEPTALSGINCIGAMISYLGPGNRGQCTLSTGTALPVGDLGGLAGFSAANSGQVFVPRVLLGVPFKVELVGFNSNGATCANLGPNFDPSNLGYSLGYILGTSSQQILDAGSSNSLTLNASFDASKYIDNCDPLIFQSGDTSSLCIGVSNSESNHLAKQLPTGAYVLCTPQQLNTLTASSPDWGLSYILGKDIDLSIFPDFSSIASGGSFTGSFNGANKTISNLTQTGDNTGLFHALNGATISNLKLGLAINSACAGAGNIGGLVSKIDNASAASTIENIKLTGSIACTGASGIPAGGLIGKLSGASSTTIQRIKSEVNITYSPTAGGSAVGGIVGEIVNTTGGAYSTVIKEAIYLGTLSSNAQFSGGLIGKADYSPATGSPTLSILDSYFAGTLQSQTSATAISVGGIAGSLVDDNIGAITLNRIYATGTVGVAGQLPINAGGLAGTLTNVPVDNSFSTADVRASTATDFITVTNTGGIDTNVYHFSGATCAPACGDTLVTNAQATLSYFYTITNAPLSSWGFGAAQPWSQVGNGTTLPVLTFEAALQ